MSYTKALNGVNFTLPNAGEVDWDNLLALQPSPCMIPNGWRADGGWCEEECGQVDCKFSFPSPFPYDDGGYKWRGFNAYPRAAASGSDCVPVECSVVSGDVPSEWL